MTIKVFTASEKLHEAFDKLGQFIDLLVDEYQLNYYELFGLLECLRSDIIKANMGEEEDEQ